MRAPASLERVIRGHYAENGRADFILDTLSAGQLRVIDETRKVQLELDGRKREIPENVEGLGVDDYFPVAEIEFRFTNTPGDIDYFDRVHVLNQEHYNTLQRPWIQEATNLWRLTHGGKDPTAAELFEHLTKHDILRRFRAYFAHKFPDEVELPKT